MTHFHNKAAILAGLQESSHTITKASRQLSTSDFMVKTDTHWSPSDYLKHLILSVKPFVSALQLPHDQLDQLFGKATRSSMTYLELVDQYEAKLKAGLRAENSPTFTPSSYKLPDNIDNDLQAHLITTWKNANDRLTSALQAWVEDDLDMYVLPHPALSTITIREMCFFTIHHNQIHCKDLQT